MKPIKFPGHNMTLAENQPEYLPLPVCLQRGAEGSVTSCWKLTLLERVKVFFTGRCYITQLTFRQPLQPQRLEVDWTEPTCKGCGHGISAHTLPGYTCPTKYKAGSRITCYHHDFNDGAYRQGEIVEEGGVIYVVGDGWRYPVDNFVFMN